MIIEFFPNNRRRIELEDWRPLMNNESEKRIRLDLLIPLTGQGMIGLPSFVAPAFEEMEKEGSAIDEIDLATEMEGMTFEAFSTDDSQFPIEMLKVDESPTRKALLTGCTIRNFKVIRITRDKMKLVALKFSLTVKRDSALCVWAHTYEGGTFWAEFTQTQSEIKLEADNSQQMKLDDTPTQSPEAKQAVDAIKVEKPKGRAAKEAAAKASGKPRGFTGPTTPAGVN